MFGEELPPWDVDRKYLPQNLEVPRLFFIFFTAVLFLQQSAKEPINRCVVNCVLLFTDCKTISVCDQFIFCPFSFVGFNFTSTFQLFFEDYEKESLHQVDPEQSLLKVLQHKR